MDTGRRPCIVVAAGCACAVTAAYLLRHRVVGRGWCSQDHDCVRSPAFRDTVNSPFSRMLKSTLGIMPFAHTSVAPSAYGIQLIFRPCSVKRIECSMNMYRRSLKDEEKQIKGGLELGPSNCMLVSLVPLNLSLAFDYGPHKVCASVECFGKIL